MLMRGKMRYFAVSSVTRVLSGLTSVVYAKLVMQWFFDPEYRKRRDQLERAAARAAGYGARQRPFMLRTEDGHGAPPAEPGNPVAASPVGIDRGAAGLAPRPPLPLRSLRTQKF